MVDEVIRLDRVMTRHIMAVTPDTPIETVAAAMHARKLSCTVACDCERPIGVVSERDMVGALRDVLRESSRRMLRVSEVMSPSILTLPHTATLDDAVALVAANSIRHVPVVDDDGKLVGVVTQTDLLRAATAQIETQRDGLERMVAERTSSLVEANRRLEELSMRDGLLEIGNRRAMRIALEQLHGTALRYGRPYCLALFDVDYFKRYNDVHGHLAGDEALRRIVVALQQTKRDVDSIHRYGGEEILIIFPETGPDGVWVAAERSRQTLESLGLPHEASPHGVLTVSAGIAAFPAVGLAAPNWETIVALADAALYRAKERGRNRVEG
jgi:diguanylate cyclase (GGDEF)-like protein